MEVFTASMGLCIGINRAYRGMNEWALKESSLAVAHQNSGMEFDTLRRIERRDPELLERYPGLPRLSVAYDVAALKKGDRLVVGFHGLPKEAKDDLGVRGVDLLDDLICPFIAKLDRVVERHVLAGFDVAIVGTRENHHCRTAKKIAAEHGRECYVIECAEDAESLPSTENQNLVLVGQVTGNTEVFREVISRIEKSGKPIKIVKTMCSDSYSRQKGAVDLSSRTDIVLLIDDGGDGAQSVYEVCVRVNNRVHRLHSKDDIKMEWFANANSVAVVGGILVPEWTIAEVADHVRALFPAMAAES
jgi:4-hydroxy-3-methylbut-2-enyl diphosphate reductase